MDLKALLVITMILIGIFNEVSKLSKKAKNASKQPDSPVPPFDGTESNEAPQPESFPSTEWNPTDAMEMTGPRTHRPASPRYHPRKRTHKASAVSSPFHSASHSNSSPAFHNTEVKNAEKVEEKNQAEIMNVEEADSNESFTIHSIEEARKAIIWGEILQRKY